VLIVACGLFLSINAFTQYGSLTEQDAPVVPQSRIEPISTALVSALVPVAISFVTSAIGSLFNKPKDTEERVVYGRPMQLKLCGENNCIQLLDKGTGFTMVGKGDSMQHAIGDAMQGMLAKLLERKQLSMHDLCREHIHFPHPDQEQCAGVEINTCELSKPVIAKPPCRDLHGDKYCKKMESHCHDTLYSTFMLDNCYKTCTNNCYVAAPGPCDIPPM